MNDVGMRGAGGCGRVARGLVALSLVDGGPRSCRLCVLLGREN